MTIKCDQIVLVEGCRASGSGHEFTDDGGLVYYLKSFLERGSGFDRASHIARGLHFLRHSRR